MKKIIWKKVLPIVLYVGYAIVLTVFILFGTDLAPAIKRVLTNIMYTNKISGVTLELDGDPFDNQNQVLIAGKTYSFEYKIREVLALGPGFEFTALDSGFTVSDDGSICADPNYEGETVQKRMRITSEFDTAFETEITFKFEKVYPEVAEVHYSMTGLGSDPTYVYVGMPLSVSVSTPGDHSGFGASLLYDTEYFSNENGFKALKPTPDGTTITLQAYYGSVDNIIGESQEFVILPIEADASFDDVQWNTDHFATDVHVGDSYSFTLYKDGEALETAYTLSSTGSVGIAGENAIAFHSPGDGEFTITLPNGYSQTFHFTVTHVYSKPLLDVRLNMNGAVSVLDSGQKFRITFQDSDTTYRNVTVEVVKKDKAFASIEVKDGYVCIDVRGTKGKAEIKLSVQGREDLSTTYQLEIKEDLDIFSFATSDWQMFLTKIMGHMALFAGLGFFSTLMFLQFKRKDKIWKKVLTVAFHALSGIFVAALTEIAQLYMPGRSGTLKDVLIDVVGFYVGAVCMLVLHFVVFAIKKLKAKKAKAKQAVETGEQTYLQECAESTDVEDKDEEK